MELVAGLRKSEVLLEVRCKEGGPFPPQPDLPPLAQVRGQVEGAAGFGGVLPFQHELKEREDRTAGVEASLRRSHL